MGVFVLPKISRLRKYRYDSRLRSPTMSGLSIIEAKL